MPNFAGNIAISSRFNGPPDMANGGYLCGRMAAHFEGPVEVTLKAPTPLEKALDLHWHEEALILTDNGTELAVARKATLDIWPPIPPSFEDAMRYASEVRRDAPHVVPQCFVCGPRRTPGDGLSIFARQLKGRGVVAAPWTPGPDLASGEETIDPAFIWAALDCPGAVASGSDQLNDDGGLMLLGRLAAEVCSDLSPREKCVVVGWSTGYHGRKHYPGTAVYGEDGRLVAKALATWIELKPEDAGRIKSQTETG